MQIGVLCPHLPLDDMTLPWCAGCPSSLHEPCAGVQVGLYDLWRLVADASAQAATSAPQEPHCVWGGIAHSLLACSACDMSAAAQASPGLHIAHRVSVAAEASLLLGCCRAVAGPELHCSAASMLLCSGCLLSLLGSHHMPESFAAVWMVSCSVLVYLQVAAVYQNRLQAFTEELAAVEQQQQQWLAAQQSAGDNASAWQRRLRFYRCLWAGGTPDRQLPCCAAKPLPSMLQQHDFSVFDCALTAVQMSAVCMATSELHALHSQKACTVWCTSWPFDQNYTQSLMPI